MDENTNAQTAETAAEQGAGAAQEAPKTYTAEEVEALIQSATDKRVTQALKTQAAKHQKEMNLAKLDGEERAKAEREARIAELEEQLKAFQVEANRSEIKSVLASRGLSAEFADVLNIGEDVEANQAAIDTLDKLFKAAVTAEVEKRIAGTAPKGNGNPAEITAKDAKRMTLAEMAELQSTNPDQYTKLFG